MLKQRKIKIFQKLKILNKKIIIILALIFLSSSAYSQWTNQNPVPDGNHLRSVFFINDSTGWMVGSDGFIAKTTNAGVDWIRKISGVIADLRSVKFANSTLGFAVGNNGTVLRSTNAGEFWETINTQINIKLNSISFIDDKVVFIVGENGMFLKSEDGGINWDKDKVKTNYSLTDIDFVDKTTGWISSLGNENDFYPDSTFIFKTSDGGLNWIAQTFITPNGEGTHLYSVEFIDKNNGWAGGGNCIGSFGWNFNIVKTTDGGDSWVKQELNFEKFSELVGPKNKITEGNGGIRDIHFIDKNNGCAVGGVNTWQQLILSTTNGGRTWVKKSYNMEDFDLHSVYFNQSGKCIAVGGGGSIFISSDNRENWIKQFAGSGSLSGDDIHGIFFVDSFNGYAVGFRDTWRNGGVILKTTDGGKTWLTNASYSNSCTFKDVFFINKYSGWAVSEYDGVIYTQDQGANWHWLDNTPSGNVIYFINETTGFIVGDKIFKSVDSGLTWIEKFNTSGNSIYFFDQLNGWVSSNNGTLLKTSDGGESWIQMYCGINSNLNSIRFYNQNFGVCVGDGGVIISTSDGGESWIQKVSGSTVDLNSISIINKSYIWVTGDNGVLISTTDAGDQWSLNHPLTSKDLNTIFFIDENKGWVAGLDGTIFSYKSDSVIPVELANFDYSISTNSVNLNWKTVSETNNAGFQVERRKIEDSQSDLWKNIGFIEGYGTTSELHSYNYIDKNLNPGKYRYRLKQIDFNGIFEYSTEIEAEIISPQSFALEQNYPNPFNPTTIIQYTIASSQYVQLKVYDILGNEVSTLVNEVKSAGTYEIIFDASDLSSGTYFYRLHTGSFVETKKMILIK